VTGSIGQLIFLVFIKEMGDLVLSAVCIVLCAQCCVHRGFFDKLDE
jgi:hypothetical protein